MPPLVPPPSPATPATPPADNSAAALRVISASVADADLLCPACGYNLHGLTSRQCPECGTHFDPTLVRNARLANGHPWLFEHGPWPSPYRFARTLLRSLLLVPLWRSINPAHKIHVGRLLSYAVISNIAAFFLLIATRVVEQNAFSVQRSWSSWSRNEIAFEAAQRFWPVLLWIPLSLLALSLLSDTLSRARIRNAQLLRLVVYSADVLWLFPLVLILFRAVTYYHFRVSFTFRGAASPIWYVPGRAMIQADIAAIFALLLCLTLRLALSAKLYLKAPRVWLDFTLTQALAITLSITVFSFGTGIVNALMTAPR